MAAKKSDSRGNLPELLWVACELAKSDKEAIAQWEISDGAVFKDLFDTVAQGYKLSLYYDKRNDAFGACLTCPEIAGSKVRATLQARGSDIELACRVLLYKHVVMLERRWPRTDSTGSTFDGMG